MDQGGKSVSGNGVIPTRHFQSISEGLEPQIRRLFPVPLHAVISGRVLDSAGMQDPSLFLILRGEKAFQRFLINRAKPPGRGAQQFLGDFPPPEPCAHQFWGDFSSTRTLCTAIFGRFFQHQNLGHSNFLGDFSTSKERGCCRRDLGCRRANPQGYGARELRI